MRKCAARSLSPFSVITTSGLREAILVQADATHSSSALSRADLYTKTAYKIVIVRIETPV